MIIRRVVVAFVNLDFTKNSSKLHLGLVVSTTNTYLQVGSINASNVYGRGERMMFDLMYGSKNAIGWNLAAIKPLFLEPHLMFVHYC